MKDVNSNLERYATIILGSGGAGRTAASIVELTGKNPIAFLEDSPKSKSVNGFPVAGMIEDRFKFQDSKFIIAFGTRYMRERIVLFEKMQHEGFVFANAIFPHAFIDRSASLGVGNVITAGCKVLPNVIIANNCFFCVTSSVDHDCEVQDGVYLAPGATLCGGAIIEEGAVIGANATILPEVRVGRYAVVGAGAVVVRDVPPDCLVVGVPACPA
ncbi:NeuD/PglB/VioB family sugar acetyltransferase [Burkholderiales bacterium]|nr:NeuD/PglB/VioB family sugar acetyltransferase [Burkholderiales bacterium]